MSADVFLFDGLNAATTVVGLNNVYCTQWVTQWPFPTEKIIWRSRSFEVKVMTKEKVIWSHTVMCLQASLEQNYLIWWSWCDNRCYSRDPVTSSQCQGHFEVKVILRSRSSKVKVIQGQGHLVSRSRSFGLIYKCCVQESLGQRSLPWRSLGHRSLPWKSWCDNLCCRAEQCMFDSIIDLVTFNGHLVSYSALYGSLLDRALLLDGLVTATSLIGLNNACFTQLSSSSRLLQGQGHYRVKVIPRQEDASVCYNDVYMCLLNRAWGARGCEFNHPVW